MAVYRGITVLALASLAAVAWTPAPARAEENRGGFVKLFNGKDLSGWKTEGNWTVEDGGVLAMKPRPGETGWKRYASYLWAEKKYGDFVLDLEYKHPPKGNSGIFVRVKDLAEPVSTGIEVQIMDSHGKPEPLGNHDCGGVIRTVGPIRNMAKPAGEWNRMIVTCRGSQLQVEFNGEKVVDVDLSDSQVKDRPPVGYVGLQDHGQVIRFRNIRIKEL